MPRKKKTSFRLSEEQIKCLKAEEDVFSSDDEVKNVKHDVVEESPKIEEPQKMEQPPKMEEKEGTVMVRNEKLEENTKPQLVRNEEKEEKEEKEEPETEEEEEIIVKKPKRKVVKKKRRRIVYVTDSDSESESEEEEYYYYKKQKPNKHKQKVTPKAIPLAVGKEDYTQPIQQYPEQKQKNDFRSLLLSKMR